MDMSMMASFLYYFDFCLTFFVMLLMLFFKSLFFVHLFITMALKYQ